MAFATLTTDGCSRSPAASGFTLAESLVASVILAVAAIAIVAPIMAARQQTAAADTTSEALSLARQLLEEITAKPFSDPTDGNTVLGPEADETGRSLFDNVDDYSGYSDSSSGLSMLSGVGVNPTSSVQYTRTVSVEYRASPSSPAVSSGDFALVTVTVTPSQGGPVQLSQLVTRVSLKR